MTADFSYTNREIVDEFSDMVFRLAVSRVKNPADAEDIFQEVFLRLVKSGRHFVSREHVRFWLIRVTLNCSKNFLGSAWVRRVTPMEQVSAEVTPDTRMLELNEVIWQLPKKMRLVVHLFYIEDLPTDHIARLIGVKQSTVTSQLCKARAILREKWKGECDDGLF